MTQKYNHAALREAIAILRPARVRELFDGRADSGAISYWVSGRRRMPGWARDMVLRRIESHVRNALAIGSQLAAFELAPGNAKRSQQGYSLSSNVNFRHTGVRPPAEHV